MARTLDAILAELQPSYSGSEQLIKTQQQALAPAAEAEISGLNAQLGEANDSILAQARGRGLGFSGIPVGEQAKFAATSYAPALAKVKQGQIQQQTSLSEALNQIGRDKMVNAQSIYQGELNRDEQIRQFNETLRAQREEADRQARAAAEANKGISLGGGGFGGGGAAQAQQAAPKNVGGYGFKNGKDGKSGFYFKDASGRDINALQYSQAAGIPIAEMLRRMGAAGDYNASVVLAQYNKAPGAQNINTLLGKYRII